MATSTKQKVIDILFTEQCSCVVANGDQAVAFRERGVKDLYRLLKDNSPLLRNAFIADKVVGKAAASLMIAGGVTGVYAVTISTPALSLLRKYGVDVTFDTEVHHIVNRTGTDWCPLEKQCFLANTVEECIARIDSFLDTLKN